MKVPFLPSHLFPDLKNGILNFWFNFNHRSNLDMYLLEKKYNLEKSGNNQGKVREFHSINLVDTMNLNYFAQMGPPFPPLSLKFETIRLRCDCSTSGYLRGHKVILSHKKSYFSAGHSKSHKKSYFFGKFGNFMEKFILFYVHQSFSIMVSAKY